MGEAKIFESDGFIVTTERFVNGSKVVPLDDIKGGALPFVDRGWSGMLIIAGVGLLMLIFGGVLLKFIGFLLLPGAYFFSKFTTERTVVLSVAGEALVIKVNSTELGTNLANAINRAIGERKQARTGALHDELSNLPRA